jgi:hypothetical protein
VTNSASVSTAGEANVANNAASDPTIVSQPPAACGIRPTVGLQVTRTGAGLLHATLTAGTSVGTPSNALTAVRILSVANAEVNNLNGQSHLRSGQVALPSVQQASLDVQRLAAGAFTVQIEVTDGCGPWKTLVGGGPGVP